MLTCSGVQGEQGQVRCDERPFFVADIGWVRFAVFHGAWILPLWDSSEQALALRTISRYYPYISQGVRYSR